MLLQGALLGGALLGVPLFDARAQNRPTSFRPIGGSKLDRVIAPPGYTHDVVLRWGDPLFAATPSLDIARLPEGALFVAATADEQARQFGSNCDAIQFFQLNRGVRSERGVLCVNNEYTSDWLMYPGRRPVFGTDPQHVREHIAAHPNIVGVSKAAHGLSVVEVHKHKQRWGYRVESRYNRRITAQTPIEIRGPARGAPWLRTRAEPTGTQVLGTFGNCAGGRTPWGNYLSAEENIQDYFGNFRQFYQQSGERGMMEAHRRWRMWPELSPYGWDAIDPRFDVMQEPHEAFRFGWIVEVDPMNPKAPPIKRTALGRFAHESASPIIAAGGRVAVYMGDDDRFEYVYKFVSRERFDPQRPQVNANLLDEGVLYVARFNADGSGEWLPLVYDPDGPLNEAGGFRSQAEVLINCRAAADLLGATTMDRPEDVEPNPLTGKVYIACTNNDARTAVAKQGRYGQRVLDTGPNAANPRGRNLSGHIIEVTEDGDDHTAVKFRWEIFLLAGNPAERLIVSPDALRPGLTEKDAYYAGRGDAANLSPMAAPDNLGFDTAGNLWIVTDGDQPGGANNGCFVCPTAGEDRGRLKQFMSGPVGAEICGCVMTPDNQTLFLSVQHPGEGGTLARPQSHWPDGSSLPPRSSVIAIHKEGGGVIGS